MAEKGLFYRYVFNTTSMIGVVLAVVATGALIFFFLLEAFIGLNRPYLGIFIYFIFPAMLITGLILVPIGASLKRRRMRLAGAEGIPEFPVLDLNDSSQRNAFIFFVLSTFIFIIIVSAASYKGFHFTESPTFCGLICHKVMEPEYTAWKNSPHARVACVECHIGPGAEWYVKAKISGLRQIYRTAAEVYEVPIKTPVEHLRPSRDICEQCHWPEKFYSARQKVFYHYALDEKNSSRDTILLINIGGTPKTPHAKGIHWHIGNDVTYYARDRQRLDMAYIAVKGKDGKVTEYFNTENPPGPEELAKAKLRLMDCTDCHNRPTHIYRSPGREMDEAFVSGHVDVTLPYIKKVAVETLGKPYNNAAEARQGIDGEIRKFYQEKYPQIARDKEKAITAAIKEVQLIYGRNFFPQMKVTWSTYPDHIGHFYSPGCFRCHDGKYKTKEGKTISKDCNLCHTVLSQKQENIPKGKRVTDYVHPVDIGDDLKKMNCSDCHLPGS